MIWQNRRGIVIWGEKNLKIVKNILEISNDDQDGSIIPPCYICSATILNILCPTCGKPRNYKYDNNNKNDSDNDDNENNGDDIE